MAVMSIHEELTQPVPLSTTEEALDNCLFDHLSVLPTLKEATQQLIGTAMQRAGGNQSLAARFLGLSQPALNRRLSREKAKTNNNATNPD